MGKYNLSLMEEQFVYGKIEGYDYVLEEIEDLKASETGSDMDHILHLKEIITMHYKSLKKLIETNAI